MLERSLTKPRTSISHEATLGSTMSRNTDEREATTSLADEWSHTPRTVQKRVVDLLRTEILHGDLPAGTRLIQNDVAERLGFSTTPVREAIRQLEAEGLVQIDAHRGGLVRQLSRSELSDLLSWRAYIEPEAIRRAFPISSNTLARATAIHERMRDGSTSAGDFALLNREFHMTIYESAGSWALTAIMRTVMDPVVAYVSASLHQLPRLAQRSIADHERLLDALESGNIDAAIDIQMMHIDRPRDEWTDELSSQ